MLAMALPHDLRLDPLLPIPLVAFLGLVLAGLTLAVYLRMGSSLRGWQNAVLLLARLAGLALLLLLLLQPSTLERIPPPALNKVTLVALDNSRSMKQTDVGKKSRLDGALELLGESGLVARDGSPVDPRLRLFTFNDDAAPLTGSWRKVTPQGRSTQMHRSLSTMLSSLGPGESARALVLLTDGHDFEMVSPNKTGFTARTRQTPLYAVAMGKQGNVRDVSVRVTSYLPYCYVKQKARISAMLRLVGCAYEDLRINLVRQNQVIQTQRLNGEDRQQLPVEFEVAEPEVGQYEYEIQVVPLAGEAEVDNNSAITVLNVIDQQIRVLLLEGSPYWDSAFLQRSLLRNSKLDVDSIIQYAPNKARRLRKEASADSLRIPESASEWNRYDVVILGRAIDQLLNRKHLERLEQFVRDHGGTVIFSRGKAFAGDLAKNELEPVLWEDVIQENVRLQASREGRSFAFVKTLTDQAGGWDAQPEMIAGRKIAEKKPLTATIAVFQGQKDNTLEPAVVHRRFGQGQVVSLGIDGLWRWAFNARAESANNLFDRFWDQLILWLMAGQDYLPQRQFTLRASSANVPLGEKINFRLILREPDPQVTSIPLTFYHGQREVGRTTLTPTRGETGARSTGEFLPDKIGRYRAVAQFPDRTSQELRFMVFTENLEESEVATDLTYLRKLCESSGGRLLPPDQLAKFMDELRQEKVEATPKTRLVSLWDRPWIFYLLGGLFGWDWYWRRRWGLC